MIEELVQLSEIEEKLSTNPLVILDFWNIGCGPCQALKPVVEEIAQEHTEIAVYAINCDEGKPIAEKFNIMAAPTLLFIKDSKVVKKTLGFKSKESINTVIDQVFLAK